MPIIKSAMKRARQSIVRRSHNLQVKRAVKLDIQALHTAITESGDVAAHLSAAYSEIDRAVKKGTFHRNTAARRKHQLAVAVAKASGTAPAAEAKTTKGAGKKATTSKTTAKAATKKAPAKAATAKAAPKKPAAKKAEAK